ncbi:hypothetical protein [Sulfobacillus thermosulfidooxidans]|uniref:hypothetical protein n=1 Tax=Sulfobacillus thermosulfidooxidans TaxID=28034 RepID=UPI00031F4414|nr:hypothetical protein [Sulfobacillus thermosulfidooxidans]
MSSLKKTMELTTSTGVSESLPGLVGPKGTDRGLPFLGRLDSRVESLIAGSYQEIVVDYEVGASGIADSGWLKLTFKFYSDWAPFQTHDPSGANYLSAEYVLCDPLPGQSQSTVRDLKVEYLVKGHERPYQKAVVVHVVDGYLKPGDHIIIRLGDRRFGGPGTRIQTFVEKDFRMRAYVDVLGTSRFAEIGDVVFNIVSGPPEKVVLTGPRWSRPDESIPVLARLEDHWGNTCTDENGPLSIFVHHDHEIQEMPVKLPEKGWSTTRVMLPVKAVGEYQISARYEMENQSLEATPIYLLVDPTCPVPRAYFADLHVHSNHTVGTNSTEYNFSYGRDVAGLDILGYTANDFQITDGDWAQDVQLANAFSQDHEFICFPGIEWCGNSAAGGDHNVVYLGDKADMVRGVEWHEHLRESIPMPEAWPIDKLYEAYASDPDNYLLMPHVGGRRCNLDWYYEPLDRLVEVHSAWGSFPWLLEDAMRRGYKLGVAANGDEHRGRCGGGVPGTAVFGTKGGLTGVLAPELTKKAVAKALRERHTWATTGEHVVAVMRCGTYLQGDEWETRDDAVDVEYQLLGNQGWEYIEVFNGVTRLLERDLHHELGLSSKRIRIRWEGARIFDRYRWATWRGTIDIKRGHVERYAPWGLDHPAKIVASEGPRRMRFDTDTFGDADGIEFWVNDVKRMDFAIHVEIPNFNWGTTIDWHVNGEMLETHKGSVSFEVGGIGLKLVVEQLTEQELPRDIRGHLQVALHPGLNGIYLRARQQDDHRVFTSPLFITRQ